jgi:hypothetical protein
VGDVEVTPRNEFQNHVILEGLTDLQIQDMLRLGRCTVNDVRLHRGLPPVTGEGPAPEHEDLSQEVHPVEEDPHMWPKGSLADLRGIPGGATTQAHIAERYSNEDARLE